MGSNVPIPMEIGSTWGEWTVLRLSHRHPVSGNRYWVCECSCGSTKAVEGSRLRKGKTTKCQRCSGRENGRKGLDTQANTSKYLYAIRCGEYFKIGVTDNVERRVKDMESNCPYPIEILYVMDNEQGAEAMYHEIFEYRHHRGEWFKYDVS